MIQSNKLEQALNKPIHGGQVYQLLREHNATTSVKKGLESLIDFSASINPVMPQISWAPINLQAQLMVGHYPDQQQVALKQAIAQKFQLEPNQITLTNGISSAIMSLFAKIRPDLTLLFTPIYSEYQRAASLHSQQTIEVPQSDLPTFNFNTLTENSVIVLVNPNTPQGQYQSIESLEPLLRAAIVQNCWLLIDESFLPFISLASSASVRSLLESPQAKKWIVLQSLTKYYACPGVRIGALFAAPNALQSWQWPSWPISVLDEQFLLQALSDPDHDQKTQDSLNQERPTFIDALTRCRLISSVESGLANFVLVKTIIKAEQLVAYLAQSQILIRNCQSFGLGEYHCRIAIKSKAQNQQLIQALKSAENTLLTASD
ncbi:MAG: threonine-phosphate decarboxylase [Thiomicrorhabdus sp.]|nr:MAG: threonine-phosphate decarboxylase [Thiomicrorhabdus sp.]